MQGVREPNLLKKRTETGEQQLGGQLRLIHRAQPSSECPMTVHILYREGGTRLRRPVPKPSRSQGGKTGRT